MSNKIFISHGDIILDKIYDGDLNLIKQDTIEKSKLLNNPKKIDMLLVLLFFIPGTPKDLLVYVGGLLPIKPWKFIAISTFARFPSIISSTLAGSNLIQGNWTSFFIIYFAIYFIIYDFSNSSNMFIASLNSFYNWI